MCSLEIEPIPSRGISQVLPPPAGGEDRGNNLVPLKDCLSPHHAPSLTSTTPVTAATLGLVRRCGPPNNWLTDHSEVQEAVAYSHLSNSKTGGQLYLRDLGTPRPYHYKHNPGSWKSVSQQKK